MLYKTRICRGWETGRCPRPAECCSFAHGEADLVTRAASRLADYFPASKVLPVSKPSAVSLPDSLDGDCGDATARPGCDSAFDSPEPSEPSERSEPREPRESRRVWGPVGQIGPVGQPLPLLHMRKPRCTLDVVGLPPDVLADACRVLASSDAMRGMAVVVLTDNHAAVLAALHLLGVQRARIAADGCVCFEI